ncbi:Asteroid domain-containing protein [Entamoeba marina]
MSITCQQHHINLIFVFDGMTQTIKIDESLSRLSSQTKDVFKFFDSPNSISSLKTTIHSCHKRLLKYLLMKYNFECIRAYSEADPVIIEICIKRKAYGVVTSDSDFYLSSAGKVFSHDSFVRVFAKLQRNPMIPFYKLYFQGISVENVKKFIGIRDDLIPMFCCLVGNDFTKSFCIKLRKAISIYEPKTIIEEVTNYLKTFKNNESSLIQLIKGRISPHTAISLDNALVQTKRMFSISHRKQEPLPIPLSKFPTCKYSFSVIVGSFSVSVRAASKCSPLYLSPLTATERIRQLSYSLYKPNCEVIEYYNDGNNSVKDGHRVVVGDHKSGDLLWWLSELGYTNKFINFIDDCMLKNVEMWKLVFVIIIKYIELYCKDFPLFQFFVYQWYSLCLQFPSDFQIKSYNGKNDHRLPIHMYDYFHEISFQLSEIIIDVLDFPSDFQSQLFYPNIQHFCKCYDEIGDSLSKSEELATADEFYSNICLEVNMNENL